MCCNEKGVLETNIQVSFFFGGTGGEQQRIAMAHVLMKNRNAAEEG